MLSWLVSVRNERITLSCTSQAPALSHGLFHMLIISYRPRQKIFFYASGGITYVSLRANYYACDQTVVIKHFDETNIHISSKYLDQINDEKYQSTCKLNRKDRLGGTDSQAEFPRFFTKNRQIITCRVDRNNEENGNEGDFY